MTLYGLKNCDTCRTALRALSAAGHDATLVDVRDNPPAPGTLSRFLGAFGEEALVNRRSATWRALPETERAQPAAELLAAHPALMKRPVIDTGAALHLGWTPATRAALGLG